MARKAQAKKGKQKKPQRRERRRWVLPVLLMCLLAMGALFGWMTLQARLTHLKSAYVYLEDLPPQMDGTTVLYVSDVNIRSAADASGAKRLMKKLAALNPDVLLLGGDYSAPTTMDILNEIPGNAQSHAAEFIRSLANFPASLGKLAVTGENDTDLPMISAAFADAGVQYLNDRCVELQKNGGSLYIAGLSDVSLHQTPYSEIGKYFTGDECVLALAHNPSAYIGIRVAEAKGGGAWADLVLSGHNLGGQIKLFDRTLRELPEEERRCLAGWHYVGDLPMLVSQGIGCEGPMLRLNTQSEAWLLTLKRPSALELPDF